MLTILRSMANLIISSLLFPHVRLGKGKTGTLPQRPCKSWFTPLFTGDVVNCKCQQITMPKSVKRDLCDIRFEEKRFIVWQNLGFPLSLWPDRKLLSSWIRPLSSGNLHLDENICFCIFSFFIYLHLDEILFLQFLIWVFQACVCAHLQLLSQTCFVSLFLFSIFIFCSSF